MPWDGNGSFIRTDGAQSGERVWRQSRDGDETINAHDLDIHHEDIAAALENCIARDGQNAAIGDLPMGGYKHTNVAVATAADQYATKRQVTNTIDGAGQYFAAVGIYFTQQISIYFTANPITSLPFELYFFAPFTNTGSVRLAYEYSYSYPGQPPPTLPGSITVNHTLKRTDGENLEAGDMQAGTIVRVLNGTQTNIRPQAHRRILDAMDAETYPIGGYFLHSVDAGETEAYTHALGDIITPISGSWKVMGRSQTNSLLNLASELDADTHNFSTSNNWQHLYLLVRVG